MRVGRFDGRESGEFISEVPCRAHSRMETDFARYVALRSIKSMASKAGPREASAFRADIRKYFRRRAILRLNFRVPNVTL